MITRIYAAPSHGCIYPVVHLRGKWIEDLGFKIGDALIIESGQVTINGTPQEIISLRKAPENAQEQQQNTRNQKPEPREDT